MGEDGVINSADREAFASFGEEKWRAKFLLKRHIDLDEVQWHAAAADTITATDIKTSLDDSTEADFLNFDCNIP